MTSETSAAIAAVALAGGGSTRMGRDKTLLTWPPGAVGGVPLWRHALDRLARVAGTALLADGGRGLVPESIADGPGSGPVAGILGAARMLPGRALLVLAADQPRVPVDLLRHLADTATATGADWVVPRRPRGLEPLCAVYRPAALAELARRAEAGVHDLHGLADAPGIATLRLGPAKLRRFGDPEALFVNLNRPEDWRRLESSSDAPRR